MKPRKIFFVLLLTITTSIVKTQTLSGVYKNNGSSTGSYYTDVKWQVSYSFEEDNGSVYLKFYNPKISIPNHSKYNFYGDIYSLGDIGLSSWPQSNQLPYAMQVKVNVTDGNKNYDLYGSCDADGTCERTFITSKANIKNYNIGNMNVPSGASSFHANLGGEPKTEDLLKNIKNKQPQNKMASSNDEANNSTSETVSDVTTPSSQYTPTYTKQDATNEIVAAAAPVVDGLLDSWSASIDRKIERRQAESKEYWNRVTIRAESRFIFYYDRYINLANAGNENAQMILYLESDHTYVPKDMKLVNREEWLNSALKNKNEIAILYKFSSDKKPSSETLVLLTELADAGNVDAMVMLGEWYSIKNKKIYHFRSHIYGTSSFDLYGGENEELAWKYLTKAAEAGSPNAMCILARIYLFGKNGVSSDYVKFKIEKDEKLAFEWLQKSIIPNYKESDYQSHHIVDQHLEGSKFTSGSYYLLSDLYKKGKVIPKDLTKAAELKKLELEWDSKLQQTRGAIKE